MNLYVFLIFKIEKYFIKVEEFLETYILKNKHKINLYFFEDSRSGMIDIPLN